jgi:site-specific DNA recombinase
MAASRQEAATNAVANELPGPEQIKRFCAGVRGMISNLNFSERRAIVLNTVEKIVSTQKQLRVYGLLPITDHVNVCTEDRHGVGANRLTNLAKIPFEFLIPLPDPRTDRIIVSRDQHGRILRSVPHA